MIAKDIMLAAVANTPNALMFANDSFLDDEDIILEAIKKKQNLYCLQVTI